MKLRHLFIGMLLLAAVPAVLVALIALDHNPQEEFYNNETGAFTSDIYVLFGACWLIFASPALVVGAIYHLAAWFRDPE